MRARRILLTVMGAWILVAGLVFVNGCGSGPTVFLHPNFDFGYVERVAVVPFENLTRDQGAGARFTRLFVSELLAAEAFDVVEPGEVTRVIEKFGTLRTGELTKEQIQEMGRQLQAQAVIFGSVGESAEVSGAAGRNVCTLVVRMVEVDEGSTVWSATTTEDGRSFWSSLLGTGGDPEGEVVRRCVERSVGTLVR